MRLNKREAKARMKIIQESHLNKACQLRLDRWIIENNETYRNVYENPRRMRVVAASVGLAVAADNMTAAFRNIGMTAADAAAAFSKLGTAITHSEEGQE